MKLLFLILFFTLSNTIIYAQYINGIIKDSINNKPLQYVNITLLNKDIGTYTNEYGEFEFDTKNNIKDTILVTSLGYKSIKIPVEKVVLKKDLIIHLQHDIEIIEEVTISNNKTEYKSLPYKISKPKKSIYTSSVPFGSEVVTLINTKRKGKIKSINFHVSDSKSKLKSFDAFFRLKFYTYDKNKDMPSELITYDEIIVKPKINKGKIRVDLVENSIIVPKDGFCIGIEVINANEIPKNKLYKTSPVLVWTHGKKKNTWINYRGKGWKKKKNKSVFKNKLFSNLLIGAEILEEKK